MTLTRRHPSAQRRRRWLAIPLTALALALAVATSASAAPAAAAPAQPRVSPYLHALADLDDSLRVAIENQPASLLKSLAASERVCFLGELAEEAGETAAATADWSTLGQVVTVLDEADLRGVERAFRQSRATVDRIESNFGAAWRAHQPQRARSLHLAARHVRQGIAQVFRSFMPLHTAFGRWGGHHCEAALAATNSSVRGAEIGVGEIAGGMVQLWSLAGPR